MLINLTELMHHCGDMQYAAYTSDLSKYTRDLSKANLVKEFAGLKLNLRQGFVSTGMGDLQSKLLTVAEAKKRKAGIDSQSRKQQKLLQAEQPKTIECAT